MMNQSIWISIVVGVFFVGLAGGYVIFLNNYQPETMITQTQLMQQLMMQSPQHRQQMMGQIMEEDAELRQQMMESMTQDPQQMQQWMANTQHIKEMSEVMSGNHDFMMEMMQAIIEDPSMRLQMIGHMTENQEAMQQMMQMMGSGGMMIGNMSDQGMMMNNTKSLGGTLIDYVSLIDELRRSGANVEQAGPIEQPFFTVVGQSIMVNGENVQVFEYPTKTESDEDASDISPDGHSIGLSMPLWVETPHFYQKEKIIVLYVGDDPSTIELLESVLGIQLAGR